MTASHDIETCAFPAELTERAQWLCWRFVHKPDQKKPSKMPYYASGMIRRSKQGSDDDRAALVDYETALAACQAKGFDGIGFAFLPDDGLIGIDLDGCAGNEERSAFARDLIDACASYTELSPSGNGYHIIVAGHTKTFKSNDVGIEVFCGSQFFTMTGCTVDGSVGCIAPISEGLLSELRTKVRGQEDAPAPAAIALPAQQRQRPAVDTEAMRYCLHALQSAVQRISGCVEGGRNDALNQEAYGLGQLLHHGVISETTVRAELAAAAASCGLPPGEAAATISSGLRAGQNNPRPIPERQRPMPAPRHEPREVQSLPPDIDPETGEVLDRAPSHANDNACVPQVGQPDGYDLAAVDWYSPFPDINGKGKPLSTIENVREACRRLRVTVRYNVIRKDIEILIPGEGFSIDNQANASLAWLASACTRFGVPTGPLGDYLTYLADRNLFNPVAKWITSKPWDGKPRLQSLMDTIHAEGQDDLAVLDLKEAMIRRWLISACAATFNPAGVSAHGVLVLQGDQYLGKTKWFKSLAPAELGVIQDGLTLQPSDKDSVKNVVRNWLVELGELDATFRKSDIAQLKSFLTKDRDVLRRPYDKRESEFARRTVFFASVNPRQFLYDPTGNRRYWTISCTSINHSHDLDMQQVWAEVYEEHFLKGEGWFLEPGEMAALNDHNRDHEVLDPIRERLLTRMDWQAHSSEWRWMTATDIMLEIGFDRPSRADVTQCGQIVQDLNGGQRKKSSGKALAKVPPSLRP